MCTFHKVSHIINQSTDGTLSCACAVTAQPALTAPIVLAVDVREGVGHRAGAGGPAEGDGRDDDSPTIQKVSDMITVRLVILCLLYFNVKNLSSDEDQGVLQWEVGPDGGKQTF